jgi:hypothetical protein
MRWVSDMDDLRAALSGPIKQREHDRQIEDMHRKLESARSGVAALKGKLDPSDLKYGMSDTARDVRKLETLLNAAECELARRGLIR